MISGNYLGGLVRTSPVELTTTSVIDVYLSADKFSTLAGFCIVNNSSSARIVSCFINQGSDVLFWKKSIPANDTIVEADVPLIMREGDIFKAQSPTANEITVTPIIIRGDNNGV